MCLILLAQNPTPELALVVAANRDEFHRRPTLPADFWLDYPNLLAGKDQEAGGTWLGVTRTGRFAAITNCRDGTSAETSPEALPARSRGALPLDFLAGDMPAPDYLNQVAANGHEYRGFNLLVRDQQALWYYGNHQDKKQGKPVELAPDCYGLSNQALNCDWPKVVEGQARLKALMAQGGNPQPKSPQWLTESLFALLTDEGDEREFSNSFIRGDEYGTRAATVVIIMTNGEVHFEEQSFGVQGAPTGRQRHAFG